MIVSRRKISSVMEYIFSVEDSDFFSSTFSCRKVVKDLLSIRYTSEGDKRVGALLYGIHEKTKREIHRTSVSIMLEDNIINPEEYTVTVDSRVYFSISDLCNELGITYEQIDQSKSEIVTEDNTYYLKKNSSEMEIANNDTGEIDSQLTLSKKVFEYNSDVYIYVRDLSLFMPVITKWNSENNTIYIKSFI